LIGKIPSYVKNWVVYIYLVLRNIQLAAKLLFIASCSEVTDHLALLI